MKENSRKLFNAAWGALSTSFPWRFPARQRRGQAVYNKNTSKELSTFMEPITFVELIALMEPITFLESSTFLEPSPKLASTFNIAKRTLE